MKQMRYTLKRLQTDFPNDDACLKWLKESLYPDGITCPNENKITLHHKLKNRKAYSCDVCGRHTYITAGTIYHKSSTPLTFWFYATFLMANTRAGISAKQLERELGVTYKCAWRMFHQIRKIMTADNKLLVGEVEVDEMYVHPDPQKRSTAKSHNSQVVFGMVERGGRAKVKHVKSSGVRVLTPTIKDNVKPGTLVYSDEWKAYKKLDLHGYPHASINHSKSRYVDGNVHTQNVENLWSNMKRGIKGVYRHVDPRYLQAYIDEYAFRYSHRNYFQPMFWALMGRVEEARSFGSPSSGRP